MEYVHFYRCLNASRDAEEHVGGDIPSLRQRHRTIGDNSLDVSKSQWEFQQL